MNNNKLKFLHWLKQNQIEKKYKRTHRIIDYAPGQVRYQFGHYPARVPYTPDEHDWELLDEYAANGIKVIVLWKWFDWTGLKEKRLYEPMNPKGVKLFIEECHKRKIKVVPYLSPGFIHVKHPDYNPEWDSGTPHLREVFYDLGRMCPGSQGWRNFFFEKVRMLMDKYGFDGVYLDGGFSIGCSNTTACSHIHFKEFAPFAGLNPEGIDHETEAKLLYKKMKNDKGSNMDFFWDLWNEFLCEIYSIVKKRNGIVTIHFGADQKSPVKEKCWDYMLVGEARDNLVESAEITRFYDTYIVRFNDWSRLVFNPKTRKINLDIILDLEHLSMAMSIPYLQFPWLEDGNYGKKEDIYTVPGYDWKKSYDFWSDWAQVQEEAGYPPILGATFIAGKESYLKYLNLYKQMTTDNTVAFIETDDLAIAFPGSTETRKVSVFVNEFLWVAIANLDKNDEIINIGDLNFSKDSQSIKINKGSLTVLKYSNTSDFPEVISFKNKSTRS